MHKMSLKATISGDRGVRPVLDPTSPLAALQNKTPIIRKASA